jgi:hypothetical protein
VSRAEQILHAPTHLLMIARAQVGLGRLVAAQETYLKLTREDLAATAPNAFKRAQQEGKDELSALEPRIGQLKIVLEGAGQKKVTVKMDDQAVSAALLGVYRPVDPGKHDVVAYPVGQSPVKGSVELKDGEKKDIKLTIPEGAATGLPDNPIDNPDGQPPPPDTTPKPGGPGFFTPLRGVGIGLGVLGVAGVAVGSIFLAKGFRTQSNADTRAENCPKPCPMQEQLAIRALDDDAARQKNIGVGPLVAGGVLLGAGVVLIVIGKPKAAAPKPAGASVAPWFSGNAAGLRGVF